MGSETLKHKFYNFGTKEKPVNVPKYAIDDPNSESGRGFWGRVIDGGVIFPDKETLDRALEMCEKKVDANS